MAHQAKRLIGVEVIEAAVENARKNSQINGIENAEFICGDAASAAEVLEKQGLRPNVIVIDPSSQRMRSVINQNHFAYVT